MFFNRKKWSEIHQEHLKEFIDEVIALSIKYNIFFKAVIEKDGPKIEYYALSQEDLDKLSQKHYDDQTN